MSFLTILPTCLPSNTHEHYMSVLVWEDLISYVIIKCNAKYDKTSKLNTSILKLIDKPCRLPDWKIWMPQGRSMVLSEIEEIWIPSKAYLLPPSQFSLLSLEFLLFLLQILNLKQIKTRKININCFTTKWIWKNITRVFNNLIIFSPCRRVNGYINCRIMAIIETSRFRRKRWKPWVSRILKM